MTYLLTVINCWESFGALNWFRSVLERVDQERRLISDLWIDQTFDCRRLDELSRNAEGGKTNNLKINQLDSYEKVNDTWQKLWIYLKLDRCNQLMVEISNVIHLRNSNFCGVHSNLRGCSLPLMKKRKRRKLKMTKIIEKCNYVWFMLSSSF